MFDSLANLSTVATNVYRALMLKDAYNISKNCNFTMFSWGTIGKMAISMLPMYAAWSYGGTLCRVAAQNIYHAYYGEAPSMIWAPNDWLDYHNSESKLIQFALEYGPWIAVPIATKISFMVLEQLEKRLKMPQTQPCEMANSGTLLKFSKDSLQLNETEVQEVRRLLIAGRSGNKL